MKPDQILRKILVLLLACFLGGMGFIFAAVMAKGIVMELNLHDPWDLIACYALLIVSTGAGVTVAYILCYGLPKKSNDK